MTYELVIDCLGDDCFAELLGDHAVPVAGVMAKRDYPSMSIARGRMLWKLSYVPAKALWDELMPPALAHLKAHGIGLIQSIVNEPTFRAVHSKHGWRDTGRRALFGRHEVWVIEREV